MSRQHQAIIIWHYYEEGKLADYSITEFVGNDQQLVDCLRNSADSEPRNKGERKVILHQVIVLSYY